MKEEPKSAPELRVSMGDDASSPVTPSVLAPVKKPERTFGLKAFDVFLYPGITNFGVFATSVFFTYLTNRGKHFGRPDSWARAGGELMQKRGDWLRDGYMKMGMPYLIADNVKMVTWSFVDGSLLSPVIKGFEDNRENIARSIDNFAGTKPDDESVYAAEPRQTWKSVLGGRALTAGIVAPTAGLLNNVKFNWKGVNNNVNYHLFTRPGIALGKQLNQNADLVKRFGKENIEEVANCTFFEAFYTSVCTVGQYFFSRMIAEGDEKRAEAKEARRMAPNTRVFTERTSERLEAPAAQHAHSV